MSGSKRPLGDRSKKGSIRWDEQNLEENERIKKELNPRKIDEPKTPYLSPMDTDEEGDLGNRMGPLSLDDAASAAAAAAAGAAGTASAGTTSDDAAASGSGRGRGRHVRIGRAWSDSDRTVSPSPRHPDGGSPSKAARSPRFSDVYYDDDLHEHDDDEGDLDPQRQEKRRRFKEARKAHYNMREQLARARQLMEVADDDDVGDLAAAEQAEGSQEVGNQQQQQQQQQQQVENGLRQVNGEEAAAGVQGSLEGEHLDADVESEHEGFVAQRQRGAAALKEALTGHPIFLTSTASAMSDD